MAQATKKTKGKKAPAKDPGLLVSDRVEILDVRLITCRAEQTPEATTDTPKTFDIQRNVSFELDRDLKLVLVFVDFSLIAQLKNMPKGDPILQIQGKFLLTYRIRSFRGLSDAAFQQFGEMNGVYNAWPYWREFTQSTTSRMGIEPLTLPVFRIVSKQVRTSGSKKTVKKKKATSSSSD